MAVAVTVPQQADYRDDGVDASRRPSPVGYDHFVLVLALFQMGADTAEGWLG